MVLWSFNKALKSLLRKFVKKEGWDWNMLLPYLLFAYCEVPPATTGFSSFELLYGREVYGSLNVVKEEWEADKKNDWSVDWSVLSHILAI